MQATFTGNTAPELRASLVEELDRRIQYYIQIWTGPNAKPIKPISPVRLRA